MFHIEGFSLQIGENSRQQTQGVSSTQESAEVVINFLCRKKKMANMTILLYVNLFRDIDCEGAYPQSVAYEIPAGCYAVDMLAAVLLVMEQTVSNPYMKG